MTSIAAIGRFKVHDGKFERFKEIVDRCTEVTRRMDKGTTEYQWFATDDHREVVVKETYTNSDALVAHATNVAAHMSELQKIAAVDIQVFGEPSKQLQAMLDGMGVRVYRQFARL